MSHYLKIYLIQKSTNFIMNKKSQRNLKKFNSLMIENNKLKILKKTTL
jgi:hypothetical protein